LGFERLCSEYFSSELDFAYPLIAQSTVSVGGTRLDFRLAYEFKSMMIGQKPLVIAIRTLLSGGFVFGLTSIQVKAGELPVPSNAVTLSSKPVEIATQGNASASMAGNNLTIHQNTDKAVLNWQTFNIGPENSVKFEQPSSSSIALNNIHQANASQIMGKLTANGQVYLVNQNGFVFGKDAQVNVNSLVATTLGISNEVFQQRDHQSL
jgi:filamentous hemagglutinin family protein